MTVKSLKKQLMAAIAMVLVATIALGSSTYAWFASNNKVSATGMQVQATAEGGIEIAYVGTTVGTYATSASAGMSEKQVLYPTSTVATATSDAISSDWYHASAALASAKTALDGTYSVLSLDADGKDTNNKYYFLKKTFNVRSVSDTKVATNLKVKNIQVTGNSQALSKSLRVAVVNGANVAIYAPVYTQAASETSVTYSVATAVSAAGVATMGTDNVTALYATEESAVIAATVPATTGDDINIYVWYEGEDSNHFSNNLATTLDTISLTVNFEATIE